MCLCDLGYDKATQPVQVSPRLVTKVTRPVIAIALTVRPIVHIILSLPSAAVGRMSDGSVGLGFRDGLSARYEGCGSAMERWVVEDQVRLPLSTPPLLSALASSSSLIPTPSLIHPILIIARSFPAQGFPSEIQAYRPPQAVNNAAIAKVVCSSGGGENLFAAVSENGEIFTFGPTDVGSSGGGGGGGGFGGGGGGEERGEKERERERERERAATVRPQRVWALRKQWSAVRVCDPLSFSLLTSQLLYVDSMLTVCCSFIRTRR